MTRSAIICGSAPDGFTQKKINEMHDFLTSEAGGSWAEEEITIFPNGVSEAMLSFMIERLKADKTAKLFLYICTLSPVADKDKSVWLGGEEVQNSVIENCRNSDEIDLQVVYNFDRELVSDKEDLTSSGENIPVSQIFGSVL